MTHPRAATTSIALQLDYLLLHMMALSTSYRDAACPCGADAERASAGQLPDGRSRASRSSRHGATRGARLSQAPLAFKVGVAPGDGSVQIASLDHAIWFRWPFRFDDWLFATFEGQAVANGRAYSRGSVFERSGRIVASVMQEGVLRPRAR